MDATDIAFAGAAEQARLLAAGTITAPALLELYLERIGRLDREVRSYRVVMADSARREAAAAQERLDAGERLPMLGVPIAIKDDVDVAGEFTCYGTSAYDLPATADAEVVRRLRDAGAVILGKTAVPEMMLWPFTETVSFGATHNPWDLAYTPGGSSGGSGAALAAGLAAIALGSDGAGSIRIPASWCGLFGLKPQRDRVPIAPHDDAWLGLSVNGPLSRTVADSALFLDVTNTGKAPRGGFVKAAARKPGRLRIALSAKLPPTMIGRVGRAQQQALDGVETLLRDLGHEVIWRDPDYPVWALYGHVLPRMWRGVYDDVQKLPYPERLEPRTRAIARLGGLISDSQIAKVRAAESAGDEDRQAHPEAPSPRDRVVVAGRARGRAQFLAAGDDLGHHPAPEQDEDHRPEEFRGALAHQLRSFHVGNVTTSRSRRSDIREGGRERFTRGIA